MIMTWRQSKLPGWKGAGEMPRPKKEISETQLGVKAAFLKERSIEDCLNCPKPRCNGCPISEREDPAWRFMGMKHQNGREK